MTHEDAKKLHEQMNFCYEVYNTNKNLCDFCRNEYLKLAKHFSDFEFYVKECQKQKSELEKKDIEIDILIRKKEALNDEISDLKAEVEEHQRKIDFLQASQDLNQAEFDEVKAELELKKAEIERRQCEYETLRQSACNWMDKCKKLEAEVERLKNLESLEKAIYNIAHGIGTNNPCEFATKEAKEISYENAINKLVDIASARKEAIKEFAERLREETEQNTFDNGYVYSGTLDVIIENLAKEMTE